ncbi:MAG TPA: hypothetical protein PLM00_05895 [Spirochaetota bacterium]|nr:hypothetical protein [Spirochaetota bacterium]
MKRIVLSLTLIAALLAACGGPSNETPQDLVQTLLKTIAKNDMETYSTYAVYYDRAKVLDAFLKARESGARAGVNWDDIKIRNIEMESDDDYVATFESAGKMFSVKFYSIEKSEKGFVKKTSVIGSFRKVRTSLDN